MLRIKLKPHIENNFDHRYIYADNNNYVEIGLKSFDDINKVIGAQKYTRNLDDLYDVPNPGDVKKYKERHRAWGFHLIRIIEFNDEYDVIDAVRKFEALDEVEYAEPIYKIKPDGWVPNDTYYNLQYALPLIDAPKAWEIEKGNPDVIVAILDFGMQFDHEDLEGNMWEGIGPDGENTHPHPHGTHVGGIVGAVTNNNIGVAGVAGGSGANDGVSLMTIDIYSGGLAGNPYLALKYAADNGAAIAQNSWSMEQGDFFSYNLNEAIDYFNDYGGGNVLNGGLTIFSAGNNNDNTPNYPAYYGFDDPNILGTMAVAATDGSDEKWANSNYGNWIDISAPGVNIYSTVINNGYGFVTGGTSYAAPHVSGVAALIISNAYNKGITLSNTDVWDILVNSADCIDNYNPGYEGKLGAGRVNAYQAFITGCDYDELYVTEDVGSGESVNFKVAGEITATNTIEPGADATYQSVKRIVLKHGFHAKEGSNFHAYIAPCFYSGGTKMLPTDTPPDFIGGAGQEEAPPEKKQPETEYNYDLSIFPNPFDNSTTISFSHNQTSKVKIHITNTYGQKVLLLHNQYTAPGNYEINIDGNALQPGVYFCVVETEHAREVVKIVRK